MRLWIGLCCVGVIGFSGARGDDGLPSDAKRIVAAHEEDLEIIEKKAELERLQLRKKSLSALRELQTKYTKEGKLEEAIAIRDTILSLEGDGDRSTASAVLADPERLYNYEPQIGKSFLFLVKGAILGSVWGTDVYTGDTHLATAAVHAGALQLGETGVVKVTILPAHTGFTGTSRNGVTSSSWSSYSFSYKVERAKRGTYRLPKTTAATNTPAPPGELILEAR